MSVRDEIGSEMANALALEGKCRCSVMDRNQRAKDV